MAQRRATIVLAGDGAADAGRAETSFESETTLTEARAMVDRGIRIAVLVAMAFGFGSVLFSFLGRATWSVVQPIAICSALIVLGMLGLRAYAHREGATAESILHAGLLYVIFCCGLLAYAHAAIEGQVYGRVTAFGPFTLVLISFPIVIPATGRLALVTVLFATAVVPIAFFFAKVSGFAEIPGTTYLEATLTQILCGTVALLSSNSLGRLRRDAARAARMGSYELVEPLGEGGMGEVWRARHDMLAREAAIKLIKPGRGSAQSRRRALTRFRREAQSTALLTSPHTVRLFDFGVTDQKDFYYVMELLQGMDLHALVRDHGRQPVGRVLEILIQACDSLGEAHSKGLIHRDIKPANIMLCRVGLRHDVVKVLDFGVVALRPNADIRSDSFPTGSAVVGTPAYMAPEAVSDDSEERSDLYSLGCVGYYLLTGRRVFERENATRMVIAHADEQAAPPSKHGVSVSEGFERALMRCLEKSPEARHADAAALQRALLDCRQDHPWTELDAARWWGDRGAVERLSSTNERTRDNPGESSTRTLTDEYL
jgi:serine/threonine-protein kinase